MNIIQSIKNIIRKISKRKFPFEPMISVEIDRDRIIHNLNQFRKIAPKDFKTGKRNVAPVLKSNAYGHGLFEIAKILKREDVPFFVVDSYFEAVTLRSAGFKPPLLIIGYVEPRLIARSRLKNTYFTITSIESLRLFRRADLPVPEGSSRSPKPLIRMKRLVKIHLKIDTGMHRQGILPTEIDEAIEIISGNNALVFEGICSHLSDADNEDSTFTESQINTWNYVADKIRSKFKSLKYFHISNTDGHRFPVDIIANVSRLGIGLYGLIEGGDINSNLDIRPAMEVRSIITGIKNIKNGDYVGYSNSFRADKPMTIATIPIGYYEGVDRRLSSDTGNEIKGYVLVGSGRIVCPIIGNVSMNITTIDVSDIPEVHIGDRVVVFSKELSDPNCIKTLARNSGVLPYELACHIPAHLKRIIV